MATLIQFSKNIRKRGRQVENSETRLVKAAATAVLRSVVLGTRVDKGVARSNWRVGIGSPTRSVIKAYSPYPKGSKGAGQGMGENANASAAIAVGRARIASVKGISSVGLKTAIYVSNNIVYPSKAFPTGLVETATLSASVAIKGVRIFD